MMKEKQNKNIKAQAGIITTILVILIVLFAIVVVWNVVFVLVGDQSSGVTVGAFLFDGDIEYFVDAGGNNLHINVTRGTGGDEILGVKFIIEMNDGKRYIVDRTTADGYEVPEELETKNYQFVNSHVEFDPDPNPDFNNIKKVFLVFVYSKDGKAANTHELDYSDNAGSF